MKLETAQNLSSKNAVPEDIRKAVNDDKNRGEFVILSQGDEMYLQASGDTEPFTLEYREGHENNHFQCLNDISRQQLESVFLKYLSHDASWKSDYEWEPMKFKKPWWQIW